MYQYKYVELDVGGGILFGNNDCAHRQAIDANAKDGWRYAGYLPISYTGRGSAATVDLIFEREETTSTEN